MEAESESASIEKLIYHRKVALSTVIACTFMASALRRVWMADGWRDGGVRQPSRWMPPDTGSEKYDCDVVVGDACEDVGRVERTARTAVLRTFCRRQ